MAISVEDLEGRFGFHPATPDTAPVHARIRDEFLSLAVWLHEMLPESREKSLAMTSLQEGMMWANAGVAMQAPLATDPERART